MPWTLDHIKKLKEQGKIHGFTITENKKEPLTGTNGKIVSKHFPKRSKEKDFIAWNLFVWAQEQRVQLMEEYRFDEDRRFKSDWAIPELKLLIEYEGGIFDRTGIQGHTHPKGIQRDIEKYNLAQQLGFIVLRFSLLNYKTLPQALKKFETK
jgi:very-short-patch-repair endonuclease